MNRSVELRTDNVTLSISVTRDLVKQDGVLKNFGYFIVDDGSTETDNAFWDNIEFFYNISKKKFKENCKKELKKLSFNWREIFKEVKELIEEANRLNLITL